MAARIVTAAFEGVDARRVDVEVQISSGQVTFIVVGLGDKAVAESRERVRAAGGSVIRVSDPGNGTRIDVCVPLTTVTEE